MNSEPSITERPADSDLGRTRWSMVAAAREGGEADARKSLADLCRRYWVPVYLYVRQTGRPPEDAAQLVQAFLSELVAKLRPSEPRLATGFREYLRTQLERFLARDSTPIASIEMLPEAAPPWPIEEIERRRAREQVAGSTPEEAMQRGFMLELLRISLARLEREAERSGRRALFDAVRPYLSREPSSSDYAALAERLSSAPLTLVIAVKRLRQRFQEIIDEELAETVGDVRSLRHERESLLSLVVPGPKHD